MAYTFTAHMASLIAKPTKAIPGQAPARLFALIDAAQLTVLKKPLQRYIPDAPSALVFEASSSKSALALSPVLYELSDDPKVLAQQILALDTVCQHLPIMSILCSTLTLDELEQHLRSLLLIEADETAYMLRFADSQMLAAINSVFTPSQRARFFDGLQAWLTVDHQGHLHDAANGELYKQALPAVELPLQLDAIQTHALMTAVAIPTLASQVRELDMTFAQKLTHAQQTAFICECVAVAQEAWIPEDELTAFALQRWQTEQEHSTQQ